VSNVASVKDECAANGSIGIKNATIASTLKVV
jgi:hypothetical protein